MGRPKIDIDWEEVGQLLIEGCKSVDIAHQLGIRDITLYDRCEKDLGIKYTEFSQEKRSKGDNLLRSVQFRTAMEGNTTMQVWLGKNRLGQKDKEQLDLAQAIENLASTKERLMKGEITQDENAL